MDEPRCPKCGAPSRWLDPPPWAGDDTPCADLCVACDNADEQEWLEEQQAKLVAAAMKAGRYDCV